MSDNPQDCEELKEKVLTLSCAELLAKFTGFDTVADFSSYLTNYNAQRLYIFRDS